MVAKILSFGHFSILQNRIDALAELYDFIGEKIEERKKTWIKGNQRDICDVYLDKVEETTETHSSFHASRKLKTHD